VLPEEYGEFREAGSEDRLAKAFEGEIASLRAAGQFPSRPEDLQYFKKTWFERHPPGFVEHRTAFGPAGQYGSLSRKTNAVIRINDNLFVHGAISPKHTRTPRSEINGAIRRELQDPSRLPPGMATDPQGPLWYRGLAEDQERTLEAHLQTVLRFHGVN